MTEEKSFTAEHMRVGLQKSVDTAQNTLNNLEFPQESPEIVESLSSLFRALNDFEIVCRVQYLEERIQTLKDQMKLLEEEQTNLRVLRKEGRGRYGAKSD